MLKFEFFFLVQTRNSLFFNQELNSFLAASNGQLLQALLQFGTCVKFLVHWHVGGGEFAEMATFVIVAPTLQ